LTQSISATVFRWKASVAAPKKIKWKQCERKTCLVPTYQICYTAKILYRKFEKFIPRKGTAQPQSQFQHSCFCLRFIYSQDRSAYSTAGKWVDRSWEYINRSQTQECGNWDCPGRAVPCLGMHKSKFLCSVVRLNRNHVKR
jgi:hypothetical protein